MNRLPLSRDAGARVQETHLHDSPERIRAVFVPPIHHHYSRLASKVLCSSYPPDSSRAQSIFNLLRRLFMPPGPRCASLQSDLRHALASCRRQRASARKEAVGAGPEVTQPLLAESKEDGTPCQSRDTLADEGGLGDHSAGLDPRPVAGSDVAHHVPFHPAMRNDEYDKGAHYSCLRHLSSSLGHGVEDCTVERWSSVGPNVSAVIASARSRHAVQHVKCH